MALQLLIGIRNYRSGGPAFYDSWTWVLLAAYAAALLGLDLSSLYYGEAKAVRRQKIFWLAGVVLTAIGGGLLLKNLPGRFLLVLTPFTPSRRCLPAFFTSNWICPWRTRCSAALWRRCC